MAKKKAKPKKDDLTFEQSLGELEDSVAALEGGELGLDEALAEYERGVARLKACHQQLEAAEQRIALLSGVDADGNPIEATFDDTEDDSLEKKAASRSRRRTGSASRGTAGAGGGVDDSTRLF